MANCTDAKKQWWWTTTLLCSKWGKVYPVEGAPHSKNKTAKATSSTDTLESSTASTARKKNTSLQSGSKGKADSQSDFAANLRKAFN